MGIKKETTAGIGFYTEYFVVSDRKCMGAQQIIKPRLTSPFYAYRRAIILLGCEKPPNSKYSSEWLSLHQEWNQSKG